MRKVLERIYRYLGVDTEDWTMMQLLLGEEYFGASVIFLLLTLLLLLTF